MSNTIQNTPPVQTGAGIASTVAEAARTDARHQQAGAVTAPPPGAGRTHQTDSVLPSALPQLSPEQIQQAVKSLSGMKDVEFNFEDILGLILLSMLQYMRAMGLSRIVDAENEEQIHKAAAQTTREKAVDDLCGGVIGSGMSIAGGVASLGGAAYAAKSGVQDPIAYQNKMRPFETGNTMTQATGKMVDAGCQYQGGLKQAEGQDDEAEAGEARAVQESDSSTYQEMMKLIDAVIQMVQQKVQSDNEALSRIMPA